MSSATLSVPARWLGLAGLLACCVAQAQLGGDQSTVVADAQALRSMSVAQSVDGQSRYEIKSGRLTVHEYLSTSGVVYAVTFSGGATPNLDQLLGSHAAEYTANVRQDRRSAQVNTATLKAVIHGQPGSVTGLIWLPALLPANVTPEMLK